MSEYSVIGKSYPQLDHVAKVKGEAQYVDDIVLPNMLCGKILRSTLPHAKILNIDTSKAEALPGVKAVITGKDTGGMLYAPLKGSKAITDIRGSADYLSMRTRRLWKANRGMTGEGGTNG